MNEIAIKKEGSIKRHRFDQAKKRLKEFSENTEAELEIEKVRTDGGFFGLGDHKVTGYELNRSLETIQEHFITVNTTNNQVIREFREVYNALDTLDKDYIASIIANVKSIEKTSNDVRKQQGTLKQHHEKLENQQVKLDAHQTEIEKTMSSLSKVVGALSNFRNKLEGYAHLDDIDQMWDDLDNCRKNLEEVNSTIQTYRSEVDRFAAIGAENKDSIAALSQKLADVELATATQKDEEDVKEKVTQAVQQAVGSLAKKVKYAYWIAGGSAGLAMIELVLLLMQVI